MNKLWIAALLALAGCNAQQVKSMQPTAIQFGDSVSLAASGHARLALDGQVDFRHDNWDEENLKPENSKAFFQDAVAHGRNNGYSTTLFRGMSERLEGRHYNVILFNSGLHDVQLRDGQPNVGLDEYAANIQAVSDLAEAHADFVIWVDTTDVPADLNPSVRQYGAPAHAQVPYNQVARRVAREHGFYMLSMSNDSQIAHNVHFTPDGNELHGQEIAACVLAALQQQETDSCHK